MTEKEKHYWTQPRRKDKWPWKVWQAVANSPELGSYWITLNCSFKGCSETDTHLEVYLL